jgi:serine protease Do
VRRSLLIPFAVVLAATLIPPQPARTDDSFADVSEEVNKKVVKIFGSGGIRGLHSYGTGVLVSKDGYIFTINSHILDTRDLRVHMYDGTRYHARVVAREPELDIALCKIEKLVEPITHYYDVEKAAKLKTLEPGTGILGFSNQFQIATRDEPVSVQRGVIASYSKLAGRIGIFEASYRGDVYFVDAITNNPGAGGGVITTRKGELIGLIGRELRNELTNTWINYCVPFSATAETRDAKNNKFETSVMLVWQKKKDYNPIPPRKQVEPNVFHGIVFVPNVVERTPPYVEEVVPGSPADKAELKPDDLIVYVEGIPVPDINTFNSVITTYAVDAEVKLEVQRGDKLISASIKLQKLKKKE